MLSVVPKRYDAFLSYNSQDRLVVREVAERLKSEGLELYLDELELAPGREFQPVLAEGLRWTAKLALYSWDPTAWVPGKSRKSRSPSTSGLATRRSL